MPIQFAPTNSFCYQFSRYEVLPEIISLPEVQSGESFRLVELVKRIVDQHLTPAQQATAYPRAQTGELLTVIKTIKWYVPYLAKKTEQLVSMGNGVYRLPGAADIDEADLEDAVLEDEQSEVAEPDGFIYAFTFPTLIKQEGVFPIKIGRTTGDVEQRVTEQCKGTFVFDNPQILAKWKVVRVRLVESAIHEVLDARDKWRKKVPGKEWFDTTVDEISSIIDFIGALRQ